MENIINFGKVAEEVEEIKKVIGSYNYEDQLYILAKYKETLVREIQKLKVADTVNSDPIYKIANKLFKKEKEDGGRV